MVSLDKLDFLGGDSEKDGSGSGSPGTCAFPFYSGKSVGSVSGVGSGIFVPTGTESLGDVVTLVLFVPRGFESKGSRIIVFESKCGRLIESFWHQKY